jgi:glycosyltransferase involved in cell wall biosynthesis
MTVDVNICLLARYFNLRNGGIGRYAMSLRDGLLRNGYHVYGVSEDLWFPSIMPDSLLHYFSYSLIGTRLLMPRDCDVYHATQVIEAIHLPYGEKPTVVTVHDLIPLFYAGTLIKTHYASSLVEWSLTKTWFKYTLDRAVNADRIIAISEEVANQLISYKDMDPDKVIVIPNGIPDSLHPRPKPDDIPRVGFLGYLDPRKRIDLLIRAYKVSRHDGELWIAGDTRDTRYKAYLMRLAEGDKRIRFLGFWPDDRLADFYNSIDLFIFPTKIEGYGLPIIEALACGRPVVTLDDGIIPRDIKEHTHIVSKHELTSIIEAPPMIDERNILWASGYRWDRVINMIINVYMSII